MEIRAIWSEKLLKEGAAIREAVFMGEQHFSYEFDETDDIAHHLLLTVDGHPAGAARIFESETVGTWLIGRVAVSAEYRKLKLGSRIMRECEKKITELGGNCAALSAQCRVQPFYEKNGYVPSGEVYLDEYCPHIHMEKELR